MPADATQAFGGLGARSERWIERLLFASRWVMAPVYLGLAITILLLAIKFLQELIEAVLHLFTFSTSELVMVVLSLVDLSLAANLVLIIMLAGYENFVAKLRSAEFRPAWLGHVDFADLKLKVIASIIAISAVYLLEAFLQPDSRPTHESYLQLVLFLGFVTSGVLMALMDRIAAMTHAKLEGK